MFFSNLIIFLFPGFAFGTTLISHTGNELNGLNSRGELHSSDYKIESSKKIGSGTIRTYKFGKARRVQILKYNSNKNSGAIHAISTDFERNSTTSAIVRYGKIESQINCNSRQKSCYVVTNELCKNVLKASGKSSFNAILDETQACERVLNTYDRALRKTEKKINKDAYKLHGESANLISSKDGKIGAIFSGIDTVHQGINDYTYGLFGNPQGNPLKSSGGVRQKLDSRIYGMLNLCELYTSKNAFLTSASKKVLPKSGTSAK